MTGNHILKATILALMMGLPASATMAQLQLGAQPQQLFSIKIKTYNFEKVRRFYIDVVGLKEMPGSSPSVKPKQSSSLSFSGTYADSFIMLLHNDADGTKPPAGDAHLHLVFKVTDTKVAFERARAAGAPVVSKPEAAHGMPNLIVARVRDPDGNVVELMQAPSQ